MLVGIFEKSRRVRTARNSFGLVESDMSSPVARPLFGGLLLGSRASRRRLARGARLVREGEEIAGEANPSTWTFVCARSGVTVLVTATPKARCTAPREAFCGVQKLGMS